MKKKYTESQINNILNECESGVSVSSLCEKYEISQATFYNWKKKYLGNCTSEIKRLKELEEENLLLKKMYVELSVDNRLMKEMLEKN